MDHGCQINGNQVGSCSVFDNCSDPLSLSYES